MTSLIIHHLFRAEFFFDGSFQIHAPEVCVSRWKSGTQDFLNLKSRLEHMICPEQKLSEQKQNNDETVLWL